MQAVPSSQSDFSSDKKKTIEVQFVLLQNFSLACFAGAVDALVTANLIVPGLFSYSTTGVGSKLVTSDIDIAVSADFELLARSNPDNLHQQLKVVVVCGGYRCPLQEFSALSAYLRMADKREALLCSLWNGAIHLAHAGLLNDQKCAIHPENHAYLKETYPRVELSSNSFYVSQRRASCSAAVSAIEMMLSVIAQKADEKIVRAIREIISCDKQPDHQDSTPLQYADNSALPTSLASIVELMRSNVEEPLNLKEISSLVNLSTRQIERLFQNNLETTPSRYYVGIRVDFARQLLMQSQTSIFDIALASGFITTSHFSNCFKKCYGVSPTEARTSGSVEKTTQRLWTESP